MARRSSSDESLTPLELEIMTVLWETGPANVQTVQSRLKGRELAYTTVQTMLNVLHRKGKAKRVLQNRAYVYSAVLSRPRAVRQAVSDVIERFFGGSAEQPCAEPARDAATHTGTTGADPGTARRGGERGWKELANTC